MTYENAIKELKFEGLPRNVQTEEVGFSENGELTKKKKKR